MRQYPYAKEKLHETLHQWKANESKENEERDI